MEALYHQTNRLLQETQQYFQLLGQNKGSNTESIENEIQSRIDAVISNCERLDVLVHKEPVGRRQNAKIRIDQLKYDNQHLQAALRIHQHETYRRHQEENEREELLSRRFTHNSSDQDTAIIIDHSLQHNMSLQNAHHGVDDMLKSGSGILESLRDQRNTLKGAKKRILDIANTLGLSNTVLRLIERRAYQDKFILFGGMLFTMIVIVIVIMYFT